MKATIIQRVLSICLILMALITIIPVSYAEDYYDVMNRFDSKVQRPKSWSILDEAETCYVSSTYGNCIYVRSRPDKDSKILFRADEGAAVIVYARESGFALGIVKGTTIGGWMKESLLAGQSRVDKPGPHDTEGLSSDYYRPVKNEYFDEYQTMYVKSKYGNCIYMYKDPTKDQLVVAYKIPEGTECTLIARKNSMYFVITEYGHRGWVNAHLLTYDYWY